MRIVFLVVLGAITIWFGYLIARPFIAPAIVAAVFAIVFFPVHARLQKYVHNQNLAALISTLLILLLIIVPTLILGAQIRKELTVAYRTLSVQSAQEGGWTPYLLGFIDRMSGWVGRYIDLSHYDLRGELLGRLQQASSFLLRQLADTVGDLVSFIGNAVIAFFILFFLFRDGRSVYRRLAVLTPLRPGQIEKLSSEVGKAITASMYGGLAVAATQGLLTTLAFWFLGLASPFLWGMAAAIFSFIPLIGSATVWLPASIILLISGHWIKGLILLGWGAGVIGMVDNIIRPYVISGQVNFHPLHIFFALLGGVQAFGIIGLFVGPVILAIFQVVFGLIREEVREMKDEEENTKQTK